MKNLKTILSVAAVLLIFSLVLGFLSILLTPKYMENLVEGSFISQYYREAGNHDVIFVGDCEVYANFSPMELYRQQGITAYVRGTPQQMIWQSYYILKETFDYEIPKAVVFNVNSMRYDKPIKEEFNRLTIDNMRWSLHKVGIINASMTEEESFLSYVFPILRYHSRFDKLTQEDFTYLFKYKANSFSGYQMNKDIVPVSTLPAVRRLGNYQFSELCYGYLDKMRALCEENGVEFILIKAPSVQPHWYEEYNNQIIAYAEAHSLKYYNFLDHVEKIGISYQTDTYDAGLHMNFSGATKLSAYFAQILAEDHDIPDRRSDAAIAAIYDEKLKQYDKESE